MTPFLLVLAACVISVVFWKKSKRISIADVPGPIAQSFWLGNLHEFFHGQAGECDFKWQQEFGGVVRFKAPLGEDRLLLSDPQALFCVYNSGYDFAKPPARRELARAISGDGVTWAEGEAHRRQRRIMMPGFGAIEAKAIQPLFRRYAVKLADKWKDIICSHYDQAATVNVTYWLSRATLDAIGDAAFDYRFETMENSENALGQAYFKLMISTYGRPTKAAILIQGISDRFPPWLARAMYHYVPIKSLFHARVTADVATRVARRLTNSKRESISLGETKRDVLSLLVKANDAANQKSRLTDVELISQMRTVMFTGHETSANALSWTLLELARHPEIQTKLRNEIRMTENACCARGEADLSPADVDGMEYLNAVIKESLRMHPVGISSFRQATKDCVLPLSKPLALRSGKVVNELPIPRGLNIIASIAAYNRNKDVFGEDSHTFNPERWLDPVLGPKCGQKVGIYNNLLTFGAGVRSCPGWRFALVEIQAFLIELINNFEFLLTDEAREICREACLVMIPTIKGEIDKGAQLPLQVRLAPSDI